jgi:dUTP pyrophosphatase
LLISPLGLIDLLMSELSAHPLLQISVVRLAHAEGLPLPELQTTGAAGLDLQAALSAGEELILKSGERALVPTGLALQIPHGFEVQIRPRSGLALKHGVTVLNAPGTIDSDYRGEIKILLINHGVEAFVIRRGLRIAQMVVAPVTNVQLVQVKQLNTTDRGSGGFGSTGVT